MTDRREGFPPAPASSSTPVHDGSSSRRRIANFVFLAYGVYLLVCIGGWIAGDWNGFGALYLAAFLGLPVLAAAIVEHAFRRAEAKNSESPSYGRSSEGTRAGGHQTPTQNEGE